MTKRDVTIEERLERFTPRALSARIWANASDAAVGAVLATGPSDETRAVCLLSRLCTFLAAHRSWAGDVTPDLAALLTPASIDAFVAEKLRRGEHRGTVGVYRTDLRHIARAIGTMALAIPSGRQRVCAPGRAYWPLVVGDGPFIALVSAYEKKGEPFEVKSWDGAGDLSMDLAALVDLRVSAATRVPCTVAAVREGAVRLHEAPDAPVATAEAAVPSLSKAPKSQPVRPDSGRTSPTRAARAARAAYRAAQVAKTHDHPLPALAEVPPLDDDLQEALDTWRPRKIEPHRWAQVEQATRLCIRAYRPPSRGWLATQAGYLARFCLWVASRPERVRNGQVLEATELLSDPHLVERFLAEQMADQPGASRSTARSVLRRALQNLSTAPAPARIPHQPLKPPYTPAECAAFVRLARNQPTTGRKRALGAVVALGLGAGLDGKEQGNITPDCVVEVDLGEEGVALGIEVPGPRARLVIVRKDYEDLLREVLELHRKERRRKDQPLYGNGPRRRNVTGPALHHALTATGQGVEVDAARLRSTWIVAAMSAPVPLGALLHASGLRTARSLVDLLAYCPKPSAADVGRVLRRVEAQGPSDGTALGRREDAP